MKTFEEINEIAPYHPCEWQQGYGIWQAGYMQGQKDGAIEQKAIDDAELHQRFKKVLNGQKWDVIDAFREWLNDHIAEYIRHTEKGDFLAPCIFRDLYEAIITNENN